MHSAFAKIVHIDTAALDVAPDIAPDIADSVDDFSATDADATDAVVLDDSVADVAPALGAIAAALGLGDDATAALEALGAKVSGSVSRKTTAVIVGAEPGSKVDKARALGVTLLDGCERLSGRLAVEKGRSLGSLGFSSGGKFGPGCHLQQHYNRDDK